VTTAAQVQRVSRLTRRSTARTTSWAFVDVSCVGSAITRRSQRRVALGLFAAGIPAADGAAEPGSRLLRDTATNLRVQSPTSVVHTAFAALCGASRFVARQRLPQSAGPALKNLVFGCLPAGFAPFVHRDQFAAVRSGFVSETPETKWAKKRPTEQRKTPKGYHYEHHSHDLRSPTARRRHLCR
jgi:hypothetical protein